MTPNVQTDENYSVVLNRPAGKTFSMTFDHDIWTPPAVRQRLEHMQQPEDMADFFRRATGLEPDEPQIRLLNTHSSRGIVNCFRQWGKSTVMAAKAVHRAQTVPNSSILVAAGAFRQACQFMYRAKGMVRSLGIKLADGGNTLCSIQLANGSRILALPGTEETVRSFTANMIFIDEAAVVRDAMYHALLPMLATTNGDLWMMSTPRWKRGFFWDTWAYGSTDEWMKITVPVTDCPRINPNFVESYRRAAGETAYRREFLCEFSQSGAGVFDRNLVEGAFDDFVETFWFN
jgi:hypothetical protein